MDLVNLFLQHRAPINTQSKTGQTPLHVCCTTNLGSPEDRLKIATLLLSEKKIHLTAVDSTGRDPISCSKNIQLCNLIKSTLQERCPRMVDSGLCSSCKIRPLSPSSSNSDLVEKVAQNVLEETVKLNAGQTTKAAGYASAEAQNS